MAKFQELVGSFDHVRDYVHQFYVYGFEVGNDFSGKSVRTYGNERRRVKSWLSRCTESDYTSKGKHVCANMDSKTIPQNPLYTAWKSKSFTDNDLVLRFFVPDLLWDCSEDISPNTMISFISHSYGIIFDTQIVRLKLKEHEALGILVSHKDGKALSYALTLLVPMEAEP